MNKIIKKEIGGILGRFLLIIAIKVLWWGYWDINILRERLNTILLLEEYKKIKN